MNHNSLSGTVPQSISSLASLTYLDLSSNQLTGTLPAAVTVLSSLGTLKLCSTLLSGTAPTWPSSFSFEYVQ